MAPGRLARPGQQAEQQSAFLAHVAWHEAEANRKSLEPASESQQLVTTLRQTKDASILLWAASGLAVQCAANNPDEVSDRAAHEIAIRLCELWNDFGRPPSVIAREVASALVSALLDLVRTRPKDLALVRELVATDKEQTSGFLTRLLEIIGTVGAGGTEANPGGAAFVHTCHLLALVLDGQGELCRLVRNAGGLGIIGGRLLWGTTGGRVDDFVSLPTAEVLGTQWTSFGTAGVRVLEVLVTAEDPDRFLISNPDLFQPIWVRGSRPYPVIDSCLAAMRRSLESEHGCIVVQPLHLSVMRTLGTIARLSQEQARRIMCYNGLTFGPAVLGIAHVDEEATACALWYLAELSASSDLAQQRLKQLNVIAVVESALARYHFSTAIKSEATRLLEKIAMDRPPVAKTAASAAARRELSRKLVNRA